MKKINMAAICLAAAFAASAYTANTWQDVDGNWNGKYSDVRHWSRGHLPSIDEGEDAVFINQTGAQYDVEIDVNIGEDDIPAPAFFKVSNGNVTGNLAPVRFYGNGKITQYNRTSAFYLYDNARAIFDGNVLVDLSAGLYSFTNRTIEVRGSANLSFGGAVYFGSDDTVLFDENARMSATIMSPGTNTVVTLDGNASVTLTGDIRGSSYANRRIEVRGNASLAVGEDIEMREGDVFLLSEGGKVSVVGAIDPASNDVTFRMTGGELLLNSAPPTFSQASTVELSGGRVTQLQGKMLEPRMLPRDSAVYDQTYPNVYAVQFLNTFTNELSGTLLITNDTDTAATDKCGWIRFHQGNNVIYGGGRISVGMLYVAGTTGNVFDVSRIDISKRYYISKGEFTVPHDITIGAFGDYTFQGSKSEYSAHYLGATTFETMDCFDGVTVHNVVQGGLAAIPGSAFRITGGGNVDLLFLAGVPNDDIPGFRALEVCDGASAGISNIVNTVSYYTGVIRMGRLSLGDGTKLSVLASMNSVESATKVEASENARLEVSLKSLTASDTTAMTGGLLVRPVLVSGESECDIPVGNVTLVDNAGTWRVKKVGGTIYLRDDTARVYPATIPPYFWTGAVNGDWNNAGNWYGGNVPDSSSRVFFGVCDTTNIVTIPAGGVTVSTLSGAGHTGSEWFRSSEPYVFRGGKITITQNGQNNYNSAFYDCGLMPKYFECDVEFTGNAAAVMPSKSISFLGGVTAKLYRAKGGNAYFGGTATVTSLELVQRYTNNQRHTSVTILPGGSFTASAENFNVTDEARLYILGGGTMTLNGTKFAYVGAPTLTNTVDGTLAINAPYSIDADQCFVGTGRVDIASTYSSGNVARQKICGGLRLNLGSGFRTVTSANAAGAIVIAVPDFRDATLGLKGNVTYGPADGVTPTTTAAERALSIGYKATLTIDTSDPDDGTPRTLTLKEPVIGGDLTITGGGKVVLAAPGNRVGKLTLSGGTLSANIMESGWNDILVADSVTGLEGHVDGAFSFGFEENSDGTVTLRARRKFGTRFILR